MTQISNGIDAGIDLVTHNLGGLAAGKSYLLAGERGAAKTTFVLQFLYQGLKERKTCALVTNQAPNILIAHAAAMGMDLAPFLKDGRLALYEIARKDSFSCADLFHELEAALAENLPARCALEGLTESAGPDDAAAGGVSAFLGKLEAMKTTTFVTMEFPVAPAWSSLNAAFESSAAGAFLLKSTPDARVKTFSVGKSGDVRAAGAEFPFKIEAGRGIVEVLKTNSIKFPRQDEH